MNRFLNLKFFLPVAFIIIRCVLHANCQAKNYGTTINDTLRSIIKVAFDSNPAKLFVHCDKNVYLPNETIWFTAYRPGDDGAPGGPDVLSVALVKNGDRTIAAQKKFVVTGIASSGNLLVPDSIAAGDYTLVAYTNRFVKGRPDELFLQGIAVKRLDLQTPQNTSKMAALAQPSVSKTDMKFYPEGGNLVAGLPTYVGLEAKDGAGAPVALKALLLEDGKFADTITTAASGMGRFFIKPKYGCHYEIKVIDKNEQPAIALPSIMPNGVALTIPSAVVRDTLLVKIAGTLTGNIHIVVHNSRKVFYALTNVRPENGRIFKLALDSLPRGLAAVTVYNEAMQPCAERIFYAHYDRAPAITIKPDLAVYGKRKKVTLKLDFNSAASQQAIVSVSCIRTNRIDHKNFTDIESFAYLDHSINRAPFPINRAGSSPEASKYLEDLLLVRGWRRYMINYPPNDTSMQFGGFVTVHNRPAKKPLMLVLFQDSTTKPVLTDNIGRFTIANEDMVTAKDKQLTLIATGNNTEITRIKWTDPYNRSNSDIAKIIPIDNIGLAAKIDRQSFESAFDNQVMLKQVTIKGQKDDDLYNVHEEYRLSMNECGDYVCQWGVLNCPAPGHDMHTHQPIKGHRYAGGIYKGCVIFKNTQHKLRLDGISLKKEFYPYGEADITLSEPLYENTLYWKNQLSLEKNKQATVSFYTGDVKGGFSVIVQGVADNEVVFGEMQFGIE